MRIRFLLQKGIVIGALSFALAGCVANSPRQMTGMPASGPLLGLSGQSVFDTADKWSFSQAVIRYRAGGAEAYHRIPVGDYLLRELTASLNRAEGVSGLRLLAFHNTSKSGFGLIARHLFSLEVKISFLKRGEPRIATFTFSEADIGPYYSGDWSAVPFTTAGLTDDAVFHRQLQPILDEAVKALVTRIRESDTASDGPR